MEGADETKDDTKVDEKNQICWSCWSHLPRKTSVQVIGGTQVQHVIKML